MSLNASPSPQAVVNGVAIHNRVRERLKTEIPEIDAETLADTVEGISDLDQLLIAVVRSALDDETYAAALTDRIRGMRQRLDRLEMRARKKRMLVVSAMLEGEIARLTAADFTASLRQAAASLDVISEDAVPAQFWKPQAPKLDRLGLLAALKSGFQTNAAKLSDQTSQLSVRTK